MLEVKYLITTTCSRLNLSLAGMDATFCGSCSFFIHPTVCLSTLQNLEAWHKIQILTYWCKVEFDRQRKSKLSHYTDVLYTGQPSPPLLTDDTRVAYVLKTTPSLKSFGSPRTRVSLSSCWQPSMTLTWHPMSVKSLQNIHNSSLPIRKICRARKLPVSSRYFTEI